MAAHEGHGWGHEVSHGHEGGGGGGGGHGHEGWGWVSIGTFIKFLRFL